jgi:hypothetical protein
MTTPTPTSLATFQEHDGTACRVEVPDPLPNFVAMGPKIFELVDKSRSGASPPTYREIEIHRVAFSAVKENVR